MAMVRIQSSSSEKTQHFLDKPTVSGSSPNPLLLDPQKPQLMKISAEKAGLSLQERIDLVIPDETVASLLNLDLGEAKVMVHSDQEIKNKQLEIV